MPPDPVPSTTNDPRFEEAILNYLQAVDAGQPPRTADFLAGYPGLETQLLGFLADQQHVAPRVTPLRPFPPVEAAVQPPGQRFGDYELLGELGRGGMGVVYKARHLGLNRIVALKMILHANHAAPEDQRRSLAEAEAVAALPHPGIVQIYDLGTHEGLPYFSLEFCEGGSLAGRLASNPLPPAEASRLVEQVARAVQVAHEHGIVHRDLKPANVLLAGSPGCQPAAESGGSRRIGQFGLPRRVI
jgi:serine/threonine-protein kinase